MAIPCRSLQKLCKEERDRHGAEGAAHSPFAALAGATEALRARGLRHCSLPYHQSVLSGSGLLAFFPLPCVMFTLLRSGSTREAGFTVVSGKGQPPQLAWASSVCNAHVGLE